MDRTALHVPQQWEFQKVVSLEECNKQNSLSWCLSWCLRLHGKWSQSVCRVTAQRSNVASVGVPFPVDEPQHGLRRQHSLCCEMFRDRSLEEMIRGQDSRLVLETSEPSLGVPIWTFFCLWFFGCSSQLCTNSLWTEVCFDWIHKDRAGLDSDVDTFGNAGVGYEAETLATVGEKKRSFSSDMNPVKL